MLKSPSTTKVHVNFTEEIVFFSMLLVYKTLETFYFVKSLNDFTIWLVTTILIDWGFFLRFTPYREYSILVTAAIIRLMIGYENFMFP